MIDQGKAIKEVRRSHSHRWLIFITTVIFSVAYADDTEIYFAANGTAGDPNILFILDASGSMSLTPGGQDVGADNPASRYSIMKNALTELVGNIQGVNIGLINYGGHDEEANGNGVKYPVGPVTPDALVGINNQIADFEIDGFTPIVQTLYEAALYFRGGNVDYGDSIEPQRVAHPQSFAPVGTGDAVTTQGHFSQFCNTNPDFTKIETDLQAQFSGYVKNSISGIRCNDTTGGTCIEFLESGECAPNKFISNGQVNGGFWTYDFNVEKISGKYISPINNECQENIIVLLSDGQPDDGLGSEGNPLNDADIINKVQTLTNAGCAAPVNGLEDGRCGVELTKFLANNDQSTEFEEQQVINTYVVGFAIDGAGKNYLESIAAPHAGNQGFYTADNEDGLIQALTSITSDLVNINSSFSPPTISVDSANGLVNSEEVFVPMFRASRLPRWDGNVKGYRLDTKNSPPTLKYEDENKDGIPTKAENVLDANKNINTKAESFWLPQGDAPDGSDVVAGGVGRLLGTTRNLYTHDDSEQLLALTEENLIDEDWFDQLPVQDGDPVIPLEEEEKINLIQFIRGVDSANGGAPRHSIGDILHSRPVVVDFGTPIGTGNDQSLLSQKVIFVGTNEGYLHAFRASDGKELFAFMPQELLRNIKTLYDNITPDGAATHPYGMDGQITIRRQDIDNNGKIDRNLDESEDLNGDGVKNHLDRDFVWLIAGMRRGGKNYYALDVTNPEAPSLEWVIRGGEGDFVELGQSWAKPVLTKVDLDGKNGSPERDLLIFSGGYDTQQDLLGPKTRQNDTQGNAIYMVDPDTGERVWWASSDSSDLDLGDMKNSIPASVRVIDIDDNGIADRMYAADVAGRIFRIDLPDPSSTRINQEPLINPNDSQSPKGVLFADIADELGSENHRRVYYEPDVATVVEKNTKFLTVSIGSGYRAHPLEKTTQDRFYVFRDTQFFSIPNKDEETLTIDNLVDLRTVISPDPDADIVTNTNANDTAKGWYLDLDKKGGEKILAPSVTFNNIVFFTSFEPETDLPADVCSSASHTSRVYALDVRSGRPVINFVNSDKEPLLLEDAILEIPTTDILSEVYFNISRSDSGAPVVDALIGARADSQLLREQQDKLTKIYWHEEISH